MTTRRLVSRGGGGTRNEKSLHDSNQWRNTGWILSDPAALMLSHGQAKSIYTSSAFHVFWAFPWSWNWGGNNYRGSSRHFYSFTSLACLEPKLSVDEFPRQRIFCFGLFFFLPALGRGYLQILPSVNSMQRKNGTNSWVAACYFFSFNMLVDDQYRYFLRSCSSGRKISSALQNAGYE